VRAGCQFHARRDIPGVGKRQRQRQRRTGSRAGQKAVPATVFMLEAEQVKAGLRPPDMAVDLGTDLEIKSVDRWAPLLFRYDPRRRPE
jgi:hypothetical protein